MVEPLPFHDSVILAALEDLDHLFTGVYGVFESLMMFVSSFLIILDCQVKLTCGDRMLRT